MIDAFVGGSKQHRLLFLITAAASSLSSKKKTLTNLRHRLENLYFPNNACTIETWDPNQAQT